MKIRIRYDVEESHVDEVVTGTDCEDVLRKVQEEAARRANFLARLFINRLTPLQFAQEVVGYYNRASQKSIPRPDSCEDFVRLGEAEGIVTRLED